jgi:hypothetical protein
MTASTGVTVDEIQERIHKTGGEVGEGEWKTPPEKKTLQQEICGG